PGLDVRIIADTTLGTVRTRYPTRPDAPAVLTLHADLGSVRVREAGRAEGLDLEAGKAWEELPHARYLEHAMAWAARFAAKWGEGFAPPPPAPQSASSPSAPVDIPPPPPPPARVSDEELRRILGLVEAGKITARD